jgi:hypothetical protein
MINKKIIIISLSLGFLFFIGFYLSSCIDKPLSAVLPEWDIQISVPTTYNKTLGQILDKSKDTSLTYDPKRDSLLVYNSNLLIDPIFLSDSIKINPQKAESSITLSEFTFQPSQKFSYKFLFGDMFPGSWPENIIVPPLSQDVSRTILLSDFQYLDIESGTGILNIQNQFPFDIDFKTPIIITNSTDGKEIGRITIPQRINAFSQTGSTFDLAGKNISNSVILSFTISTPGTAASVNIKNTNFLLVEFSLKDIKIKSGSAQLTSQKYMTSRYFSFDSTNQSNVIQAKLKTGLIKVEVSNSSDFAIQIKAKFNEITKSNIPLTIVYDLLPRESKRAQYIDLSNYVINPANNRINYDVELNTTNTNNQLVNFSRNDYLNYKLTFENIVLNYAEGKVKTANSKIDRNVDLPTKDIKKYLDGSAMISEAGVEILLNNRLGVPFNLSGGNISGFNSYNGKTENLDLPGAILDQKSTTKIVLDKSATTNFINAFLKNNSFPEIFHLNYNIVINPNQSNCTISANDYLDGMVTIKLPMQVAIINIQSKDTVDFSFSDSDKEQFDNLNSGRLAITAYNSIPANTNLKLRFLDTKKKEILTLPKGTETYSIKSPELNTDGTIKEAAKTVIPVSSTTLTKDDILKIRDSKYCEYQISLNSPNAPNIYAQFRRQNYIKVITLVEIGYHIKDTSNK